MSEHVEEEHPPEELLVPYRHLDTAKRRRAGAAYLAMAAIAGVFAAVSGTSMLWLTASVPLTGIATYQFATGWKLQVRDLEAIRLAGEAAPFTFGHGSATLRFRGPLAKPVWQVLLFADGPAPDRRALVTIDGLTGDVTGVFEEAVLAP